MSEPVALQTAAPGSTNEAGSLVSDLIIPPPWLSLLYFHIMLFLFLTVFTLYIRSHTCLAVASLDRQNSPSSLSPCQAWKQILQPTQHSDATA